MRRWPSIRGGWIAGRIARGLAFSADPRADGGAGRTAGGAPTGEAVSNHAEARISAAGMLTAIKGGVARLIARRDLGWWLILLIAVLALVPRLYGLNWDANNHLHPDERQIVFQAMCLGFPGTPRIGDCAAAYTGPGWFFSPSSPLNPHFFAYGSSPLYLLAAVAHGLAWLSAHTGGLFAPPDGGFWDDFNHFTLVGRVLSALFDAGSVVLTGLLARRLAGRWPGVLAAALVAVIPLEVQLAHFYAVDTLLLFFVLLTLLGCVRLARMPVGAHGWRIWRAGLLIGLGFGLAMATKVSALPLLVPIGVALLLFWRRRDFDGAVIALLGVLGAALLAFLITSPYVLLDLREFQRQIGEQTQLSQGALDYPYVRQFSGTVPYLYQLRDMSFYDLGLPMALLALAGFVWAASRVWRRLASDWAILVSWIAVYFVIVGHAYTKYPRYMLPIFAPLVVCGVGMLAALAVWGARRLHAAEASARSAEGATWSGWRAALGSLRAPFATPLARRLTARWGAGWWRVACVGLALCVVVPSLLFTLALVNIYSAPNTRVQASAWIYDHVPEGSILTYEVWDDPLPILVPPARAGGVGLGLTAEGHTINPGQYVEVGLNLYDPDTTDKAQQIADSLASADVVVVSSRRLLDSIPRMPDRYPMSSRYYTLLFSGKLGFRLAAHFDAHPNLFGVTFDDSGADESYSTFDHPPVWIFERSAQPLTAQQIQTALTSDLTLPPPTQRMGSQSSLLLSPHAARADAQAQPLGAQFPADSLPNRIPLVWWLLFVELLGVFAFPLTYFALPGLYDRGWGLSKLVGLLALGWMVWLPASVGALPFDHWIVVGAFALLGLVGGVVAWRRWTELRAFVRQHWRLLAICEVAFLVAFLFLARIRSLDPDLWHFTHGGEKPFELAMLDGILRSRTMPPLDAWFSGGYINYYYYGQYLIAVLIKLTGVAPTTAFNLAIPLLFAVSFTAAFSIVAGLTRRWWAGLLGGVALVFMCNLDGAWQVIGQWRALRAGIVPPAFDYWQSSRVIPCVQLSGFTKPGCPPTTINEFPFWSFLFADLHGHVIDLPIVVLVLAACASLIAGARGGGGRWRGVAPTLGVLALALGAVWCVSTWDLPLCALLTALALTLYVALGEPPRGWRSLLRWLSWPRTRGYLAALALVFGGAFLLYAPFHLSYQNSVSGLGPVTTPTLVWQFLLLFGLWIFITASFFFVELRDRWERNLATSEGPLAASRFAGLRFAGLRFWLLAGGYALALLLAYQISTRSLLLTLLVVGLVLAVDRRHTPAKLFTYILLLAGLAVALGVEVVYIRDFLDHSDYARMNTVFKFYYEVWLCLAVGGALALSFLLPRMLAGLDALLAGKPALLPRDGAVPALTSSGPAGVSGEASSVAPPALPVSRARALGGLVRGAWVVALLILVAGSAVFLIDGTRARVAEHLSWSVYQTPPGGLQPALPSLDGMGYMRGWYPGDYAAITWMNEHIAGTPTIVEASNGPYEWYGRVSTYTGLPSVLGWSDHEAEQRDPNAVYTRQTDIQAFYATADPDAALSFLHRYGVQYVYIGALERSCFMTGGDYNQCVPLTGGALAKFDTLEQRGALRTVYSAAETTIYQVVG